MHVNLRLDPRDCSSVETNQRIAYFLMEEIVLHVFDCSDVPVD